MNAFASHAQSDAADRLETADESPVTKMTSDILPACFLLGIVAGFAAFVAFAQAVLPAMIAAVLGALLGLFLACDRSADATPTPRTSAAE